MLLLEIASVLYLEIAGVLICLGVFYTSICAMY